MTKQEADDLQTRKQTRKEAEDKRAGEDLEQAHALAALLGDQKELGLKLYELGRASGWAEIHYEYESKLQRVRVLFE